MGAELALTGKLIRTEDGWVVELEDGQRLRLPQAQSVPEGEPMTVVVTTQARYEKNKQELAQHLLAEILNGS